MLGFMKMGLHQLSGAADWISVFHCSLNRKYYYRAAKNAWVCKIVSQRSKPQSCPQFLCCFALVWFLIYPVVWMLTATVPWWVPVVYIPNCPTPSHGLYLNEFPRCAKGSGKRRRGLNHLVLLPCRGFPRQAGCALWTASLPLSPVCTVGIQLLTTFALCFRYAQKQALCNLPPTSFPSMFSIQTCWFDTTREAKLLQTASAEMGTALHKI